MPEKIIWKSIVRPAWNCWFPPCPEKRNFFLNRYLFNGSFFSITVTLHFAGVNTRWGDNFGKMGNFDFQSKWEKMRDFSVKIRQFVGLMRYRLDFYTFFS